MPISEDVSTSETKSSQKNLCLLEPSNSYTALNTHDGCIGPIALIDWLLACLFRSLLAGLLLCLFDRLVQELFVCVSSFACFTDRSSLCFSSTDRLLVCFAFMSLCMSACLFLLFFGLFVFFVAWVIRFFCLLVC